MAFKPETVTRDSQGASDDAAKAANDETAKVQIAKAGDDTGEALPGSAASDDAAMARMTTRRRQQRQRMTKQGLPRVSESE